MMNTLKNNVFFNRMIVSYGVWVIDALLVLVLFGFYEKFIVVEEVRAETLRREVALQEKNRRLLRTYNGLLASWQVYDDQLSRFFFKKEYLVEWLEFLEREARVHHLGFEASSLDEDRDSAPPYLRAVLRGTIADTLAFLDAVETGPYGMSVKEANMRQGALSDEWIIQLSFLLHETSA